MSTASTAAKEPESKTAFAFMGKNYRMGEQVVLLLHGYDSKPSALGGLADLLGTRAELVAGFEDLPYESFAWWLGDLSEGARHDGTEYLDEISLEATRALRAAVASTGLVSLLAAKNPKEASATASNAAGPTSSPGPTVLSSNRQAGLGAPAPPPPTAKLAPVPGTSPRR